MTIGPLVSIFPLFLPFPYNVVKVCSAPPQCTFGDQMFNLVNSLFFSESGMSSYGYHRGPGGGGGGGVL